jgi:hypothetical protein
MKRADDKNDSGEVRANMAHMARVIFVGESKLYKKNAHVFRAGFAQMTRRELEHFTRSEASLLADARRELRRRSTKKSRPGGGARRTSRRTM